MASLRQGSPDVSPLAQAALESESNAFFEDVVGLSPLQTIEHFCRSHQSFQVLAYSQGIAAAAAAPTAEYQDCVEVLVPVLQDVARHHEAEIRSTAVKQLAGLGTALYGKDAERSMRDIEATLLVCAQQCALDDEDEVSHAAIVAFQQLVQLLPSARATAASKRAVDRLESQGSDDGTLAAVRLLAHTVGSWTPEALRRHVPRYLSRWASHREFAVREAVATCMSLVVPAMPLRLCHQVMLPAFYQLSRDQNWRVRRACALDLPRMTDALHKRPMVGGSPPAADSSSSSLGPGEASSSSSCWQQDIVAEQRLGCCSSRPSSSLTTLQRYSTECGGITGTQLTATLAAASGPQRNRTYPSLANRSPATTAQIMTKHPMHSSLIMDGMLSSSSSCNSMPGSPTASSDATSLAHDSHDDASSSPQQQQRQQQRCGSLSDTDEQQHQQQHQEQCALEQQMPLLHDCWCALRQCMELLTADSSHWVKVAALSGLGPFLLQLPPCQLGQLLLGRFTSMAGSTVVIYEVSVALACAQAFGQLAVLLGPERWPDMRDAWHALQASRDPAVLCEVVSCLPQLMAALGPVLAHREMFPALAGLVQSHLTWISGQLVLVMADLLSHMPPSGHELLLKTLPQLAAGSAERPGSWRVRRDLALQLGRLAAVAGPEAIENSLWPTAMTLCCDPIAAVRSAAAGQIGPVLAALPPHMLQSQLNGGAAGGAADSCAACSSSSRLLSQPGSAFCQQPSRLSVPSAAADGGASPADDMAAGGCSGSSGSDDDSSRAHTRSSQPQSTSAEGQHAAASSPMAINGRGSRGGGLSRSSSGGATKERSRGFSVRFSFEDSSSSRSPQKSSSAPNSRSSSSMSRSGAAAAAAAAEAAQPGSSILSGLVAAADKRGRDNSSSSFAEFDEFALPSALAPAPAGCFSGALSASDSDDDAGDVEAAAQREGSGSSGVSSSSSRSSGSDGSNHSSSNNGSGSSSSSDDESGNDSGRESDSESDEEEAASSPSQRWRGIAVSTEPAGSQPGYVRQGTPSPGAVAPGASDAAEAGTNSDASPSTAAAAASARPSYAMHPAMMPVGAVTAAAAAAGSAPRAFPATKSRAVPSRARSTGDLLRLHGSVGAGAGGSSSSSEDGGRPLHDAVVGRFRQQHHRARQLSDSLPSQGLLASAGSSDDEGGQAGVSDWAAALPQPAHAAPHQYLPVLVEYFGCSSSHQQRQLFVPLVIGLLACCHKVLSCVQQAVLLDRLEALAHDSVPGVRYAVAAALADVRAQAAALTGQQQQQDLQPAAGAAPVVQQPEPAEQQQQQPEPAQTNGQQAAGELFEQQQLQQADAAVNGEQQQPQGYGQADSSDQQQQQPGSGHVPKGAHPLLGYQAYVQQLSRTTSGGSSGAFGAAAAAAAAAAATASTASSSGRSSPSPGSPAAVHGRTAAAAAAALPPRSAASPAAAAGSSRKLSKQQQQPGSSPKQPAASAGAAGAQQPGSGPQAAAGAATGSAGAADDAKQAVEWLMKLSNCQQLERLMHVVALTTGPL